MVLFGVVDVESGLVKSIVFVGNIKVFIVQFQVVIKIKLGDVYLFQFVQDDFMVLCNVYCQVGYEISICDVIIFQNGVLIYNLCEVCFVGYEFVW